MHTFISTLQKEINKQVESIERSDDHQIEKAKKAFSILGDAFNKLREFIISYQFKDDAEEIEFFKDIKPKLFHRLIYYRKIYNIEMNRPIGSVDAEREYLKGELEAIDKYTIKRLDFIRYYRSGATYLDSSYFLRGKTDIEQYLETFFHELDPLFTTNSDFKVAKILANDRLSDYLKGELMLLDSQNNQACSSPFPETRLTWQDSKAGLLELIYGWHSKKSFGNIPLIQLAHYITNVFNVKMDMNLSRTFSDMKIRNNPTPWTDSLKEALLKRMQQWKRNK